MRLHMVQCKGERGGAIPSKFLLYQMSQISVPTSHIPLHGKNVRGHKQVFFGEVLTKYCGNI